jgi:hypothetical protein
MGLDHPLSQSQGNREQRSRANTRPVRCSEPSVCIPSCLCPLPPIGIYRRARGAERDRSATCAVRDAYPQFQSTRACAVELKHPSNQAADALSAPVNSHQETSLSNPFPIGKSRPKRLTTGDSLINELDLPAVLSALESRQCRHTHGVSFADARNQTPLATPERNADTARVRRLEVRSCGTANNDASRCRDSRPDDRHEPHRQACA